MKVFIITSALGLMLLNISAVFGQQTFAAKTSQAQVNPKIKSEIHRAEEQLGRAILKCDAVALSQMLTNYYANASEGSESAESKQTTLARCQSGTLVFYKIEENGKLSVSAEIVTVEGEARVMRRVRPNDNEIESRVRVRRLWTKKNGRWLLVSQTTKDGDEDRR